MSLRIFEPRYVRMVKEVCAGENYFAICMLKADGDKDINTHIHKIATLAKAVEVVSMAGALGWKFWKSLIIR